MPSSPSLPSRPSPGPARTAHGTETDQDAVIRFIDRFRPARDVFLNGMCYWFSYILQGRFGGKTLYEQVDGHFLQEIDGRLYDASGDVTEKYRSSRFLIPWSNLEAFDQNLYQILLRDCVRKEPYDR